MTFKDIPFEDRLEFFNWARLTVSELLDQLPVVQKQAIQKRFLEEKTLRAAASDLKVTFATVRTREIQGLKTMQSRINQLWFTHRSQWVKDQPFATPRYIASRRVSKCSLERHNASYPTSGLGN